MIPQKSICSAQLATDHFNFAGPITIVHANGWIAYLKMDFCGKMVSPVVQSSSPVQ